MGSNYGGRRPRPRAAFPRSFGAIIPHAADEERAVLTRVQVLHATATPRGCGCWRRRGRRCRREGSGSSTGDRGDSDGRPDETGKDDDATATTPISSSSSPAPPPTNRL